MEQTTYLDVVLGAQFSNGLLQNRVDDGGSVRDLLVVVFAHQPLGEFQASGSTNGDGVTIEEIGDQDEVAIGGELIRDQLSVVEAVAKDIGQSAGSRSAKPGLNLISLHPLRAVGRTG